MLRRKAAGKPMPDAEMLKFFIDAYESILRKPRADGGRVYRDRAAAGG